MVDPQNGFWLLPSRKRPQNLVRFLKALDITNTSTPGLILIQEGEFADPALAKAYAELQLPEHWKIQKTAGDSQGDKIREIEHLYHGCEWVGLIGDDQVVRTDNWDTTLLGWVKGWNLVSCHDDGWQVNQRGGRIAGTMLWSGDLYRAAGYLFPPGLHHVYLDDIWESIGAETGCWSFAHHACPDVMIAHLHPDRGMSERDETYQLAYGVFSQTDYPVWHSWQEHEKPHTISRIRELMSRYGV